MTFLAIFILCITTSPILADERAIPANLIQSGFPVWHNGSIYLGHIDSSSVTRISADGNVYRAFFNTTLPTPYIAPVVGQKNRFIATNFNRILKVAWDGYSSVVTELETIFTGPPGVLLGNLVVATNGDYYIGSQNEIHCKSGPTNPLYKYRPGQGFTVEDSVVSALGLALDETRDILYASDQCSGIYAYDRDPLTGNLSNRRLVYPYKSVGGIPANPIGVILTHSGMILTSIQNRGTIQIINPETGKLVAEYQLPTPGSNPPAFGGRRGEILIVGSGTQKFDFIDSIPYPEPYPAPAGSVFLIRGFAQGNVPLLPRSDLL